jgi:ABC-type uncharacterized transport system ATPase subunit
MFVIRDGFKQSQNVLTCCGIEAIRENRISRLRVYRQFQLRVVNDNFTVVPDSKLAANLQRNPCSLFGFHDAY